MTGGLINRSRTAALKTDLPPKEVIDNLCSYFILNVSEEDWKSFETLLFRVEEAHWYYEDNIVEENPSLKSLTLKEFFTLLFSHCDVLKPYVPRLDDIYKDFIAYKLSLPVAGAIILDETYERCLMVKGWKGISWSFPRGKKNKKEKDHDCAIREVLEETGFDISGLLNEDNYIEIKFGQQQKKVKLYIVAGVKEDALFAPQTKKEISEIAWQRIDVLQNANANATADGISYGITGIKLYMVAPFLASIKSWIYMHPPPVAPRPDRLTRVVTVWKAKCSTPARSQSSTNVGRCYRYRPNRCAAAVTLPTP